MKTIKIVTVIVLVGMLIGAWGYNAYSYISEKEEMKSELKLADGYAQNKMYDRAIKIYLKLLETDESKELWMKLLEARKNNCLEAEEDEGEDYFQLYMESLVDAVKSIGNDGELAIELGKIYIDEGNLDFAYESMSFVKAHGVKNKELDELIEKVRYDCTLGTSGYDEIQPMSNNAYSVKRDGKWTVLPAKDYKEEVFVYKYDYINRRGKSGEFITTRSKGSKLRDAAGDVLGVFNFKVLDAGVFSENRIAVKKEDLYYYCDSYARKVIEEGYEKAGAFQNGKAAVCKNGKWGVIDTNGKTVVGFEYDEIVLNSQDEYCTNSTIIASKDGKYSIYDENFKIKNKDLKCDYIDRISNDSAVAIEQNGKWGYATLDGKVVIEPQYSDAKSFSYGLAAVFNGDKWGFINHDNKVVIDYKYYGADYFDMDGRCFVKTYDPSNESEPLWQVLNLTIGIK